MSLGEILRNKRKELGLTLDEVSGKVGFSKPYLSTIETGRVHNPPSDELLLKLERVLGFETGLLLYIAHIERLPPDVRQRYESSEAENKKFRQLIKDLMEKKINEEEFVRLLEGSEVEVDRSSLPVAPGQLVPIINRVAAGYPTDFDDLDYPVGVADDYIRCPDVNDPNAFAVRVVGDSMEPKFKEGDIVVFSPAAEVKNGDDCFIRFATPHETTFKRVFFEQNDTVRLQPRNEKYPPVTADSKRIDGIYRAIIRHETL